jgi:hypothetical protein
MTTSSAALGPARSPALFSGSVASLAGDQLTLSLRDGGTQIRVSVQLELGASGGVAGTVQGGVSTGQGGEG